MNLHRNVIFRDGKDKADQIIPMSTYDSTDPEDLWKWMAAYEQNTGGRALTAADTLTAILIVATRSEAAMLVVSVETEPHDSKPTSSTCC